jgi:quercetin dioxygenase-like cupin family protein
MRGTSRAFVAVVALSVAAGSHSLPAIQQGASPILLHPPDLKWTDVAVLPPGAKMALLQGDPSQPGVFTMRVQLPAGYRIPPHWHSMDEHLVILSGALYVGMGDKFEAARSRVLRVGGFGSMPAKMHHYAFTKSVTVFQLYGMGPFDIVYVNPADDPRTKGPLPGR